MLRRNKKVPCHSWHCDRAVKTIWISSRLDFIMREGGNQGGFYMPSQIDIFEEIIVDNFAGGGGASTGIELATGRPVTIAINHDPDAILMHKTNHPYTKHIQASVWDVDPVKECAGRHVGLAWFSPDCKHFSKAKGSALVDRNIRGLAWIVLRWAGTVRPDVIILENVEEFVTWGPVRKGKPVKKFKGKTFLKWKSQLENLGYDVDYRELVGADYGAPTTRKRLVLIARCDGKPICWPEPTHSKDGADGKKRWVSAAEIIDWSLPCYSVFATRREIKEKFGVNVVRPLAENTMRRVIRGVDKFTIKSGKPFIVECNHSGGGHVSDADEPYKTITAKHTGGICEPIFSAATFSNTCNSVGSSADQPVHTVTSAGNQILTAAQLIQYHTEQSEAVRANGVDKPLQTVDASNRHGLTTAHLTEYYGNGMPLDVREPMHTATSHDREALTAVHIQKYFDGGYTGCGNDAGDPLSTVTAMPRHSLCAAHISEFKGTDVGQEADRPLRTVTASAGEFAAVKTQIARYRPGESLGYWPQIRALLNKYCGYRLTDDEVLLISIRGAWYYISDIGLRMLVPRELYNAMGFPSDYIIDRDYLENEYKRNKQVARCGNAVCPPLAEAMVRANKPEWCKEKRNCMSDIDSVVAV